MKPSSHEAAIETHRENFELLESVDSGIALVAAFATAAVVAQRIYLWVKGVPLSGQGETIFAGLLAEGTLISAGFASLARIDRGALASLEAVSPAERETGA